MDRRTGALLAVLLFALSPRPALGAAVRAGIAPVPAGVAAPFGAAAVGTGADLLAPNALPSVLALPSPALPGVVSPAAVPSRRPALPAHPAALPPALPAPIAAPGKDAASPAPAGAGPESAVQQLAASAKEAASEGQTTAELEGFAKRFDGAGSRAPGAHGVLDALLESKETIVVAHGKNDYRDVAGESTWGNLAHSVASVRGRPVVIEVDIRQAGGRFILYHDPTFHASVRGYQTPQERIDAFRKAHPELARRYEGRWDFLLLDGLEHHRKDDLEKIKIYDRPTGREFPLIALDELLKSIEEPGKLRVPEHPYAARGPPEESGRIPARTVEAGPIALYLDFKEINHLARRLYGLSDWHWIIGSWSTRRIEAFTRKALANLSAALTSARAHDKAFIAVRHPRVAALARAIDPRIRLMASPDDVSSQTTAEEWIRSMEPFLAARPDLIEVKYLRHMRDPQIRAWARAHGLKILYDQIPQTDPSQFEGDYREDPGRLFRDIVEQGADVLVQTNTPETVQRLADGNRR